MEVYKSSLFGDANLVSYYRFNNGALTTDSKGSNTLTNNGPATQASDIFGTCANFGSAGNTNYFSVSASIFSSGSSWTITFWVKNSAACTISSLSSGYEHYVGVSSSAASFHTENTDGSHDDFAPGTGIDTNLHYVAFVCNTSGGNYTKYVYQDAVLVNSKLISGKTVQTWQSPLIIGKTYVEPNYSTGKIDDVAFFSRALSLTEIQSLYKKSFFGGMI